ncbi:uncharacterized protein [Amphiura filiformis]|uniref:uncharacterized protein n=1 Tax=Amphiura filiformis TaxID=82378 RepID=UPI003B2286D2
MDFYQLIFCIIITVTPVVITCPCFVGQQPDPSHPELGLRWVLPYNKNILCTCFIKTMFGGMNPTPLTGSEVLYYPDDPLTLVNNENVLELREKLGCIAAAAAESSTSEVTTNPGSTSATEQLTTEAAAESSTSEVTTNPGSTSAEQLTTEAAAESSTSEVTTNPGSTSDVEQQTTEGEWAEWSVWSGCNKECEPGACNRECGTGSKTRSRICLAGSCSGNTTESSTCIKRDWCRPDWHCGPSYLAKNGQEAKCLGQCCSQSDWCGTSDTHCSYLYKDYRCCTGLTCDVGC